MECAQRTWLTDKEYLRQFFRRVGQLRVPLAGSLDLSHRCNLRCVHCYLGSQHIQRQKRDREMSTEQVVSLIDEITAEGCLFLLISGGEPLLRQDFGDVYRHARTNGLLVTVFTNGTLISEPILELFADLPPYAVEITLYGATAPTYERITGVSGSFGRCLTGIQRLLECGINLKLKTMLMTLNRHEFSAIEGLAEEYGVPFRFDAGILPCLNGDESPLRLRVAPQEVIEKDFADPGRLHHWREYYEQRKDLPVSDRLYICGAGQNSFHVDPYGNLQPCVMTTGYQYNLQSGSFAQGWRNTIPRISEKTVSADYACNQCEARVLCGLCPAACALENGGEDIRSEYMCAIGRLRLEAINSNGQTVR